MIFGLEIGMLIAGIMALSRGHFSWTSKHRVSGVAARAAGFVLILPLPLSFCAGFLIGLASGLQGSKLQGAASEINLIVLESGITLGCLIVAAGISLIAAGPSGRSQFDDDVEDEEPAQIEERRFWAHPEKPRSANKTYRTQSSDISLGAKCAAGALLAASLTVLIITAGYMVMALSSRPSQNPAPPKPESIAIAPQIVVPPVQTVQKGKHGPPPVGHEPTQVKPAFAAVTDSALKTARQGADLASVAPVPKPKPALSLSRSVSQPLAIAATGDALSSRAIATKPKMELPALPDPIEIKPAPIRARTVLKLADRIGSVQAGGGGRYLILHFPGLHKLGIFDASLAKVVRTVDAPEDDVRFAAGMTKLVVFLPGSKVAERYDLGSGRREYVGTLDLPDGEVQAFCMGHASAGPLLISAGNQASLFEIERFREMPLGDSEPQSSALGLPSKLSGGRYWAGATGRIFGHTGTFGMPNGVRTVVLDSGTPQQFGQHLATWYVVPGPDGKHVYAAGHGIFTERVTPVPNVPYSLGPGSGHAQHLYIPAYHGPFYLHAQTIESMPGSQDSTPVGTVRIYILGDKQPIARYDHTEVCKYGWEALRGLGFENSVHLIPKAKLLIIVPETRDELRLYPADLEAAIIRSGHTHLAFVSSPPSQFEPGHTFNYQVNLVARNKPVQYRLARAPGGMTVSPSGTIHWDVPAGYEEKAVDVILEAEDANGEQAIHSFHLQAQRAR